MLMVFVMMIISIMISMILIFISLIFSVKTTKINDKYSPFECGFSTMKKARSNFSIKFFLITIIFLIFDIEVAILLPVGVMKKINLLDYSLIGASLITIVLLIGLVHEWKNKALKWVA